MRERILVVDDDPSLRALLGIGLGRAGYEVEAIPDALAAMASFSARPPDVAIVDVMMPRVDGWEVVRRIRSLSDTPILMLSAKSQDVDKARGLDLGADDYLAKPFSLVELEARIRALLRRRKPRAAAEPTLLVAGPLSMDSERRRVFVHGEKAPVTPTEFRILRVLLQHHDRAVTIEHLLHQVWGEEYVGEREYVKPFISRLRKKLRLPEDGPGAIETVHGVGYMMCS